MNVDREGIVFLTAYDLSEDSRSLSLFRVDPGISVSLSLYCSLSQSLSLFRVDPGISVSLSL